MVISKPVIVPAKMYLPQNLGCEFTGDFKSMETSFQHPACNYQVYVILDAKKETLAQLFSCEFCEISKNTFFTEHLWATASEESDGSNIAVKAKAVHAI